MIRRLAAVTALSLGLATTAEAEGVAGGTKLFKDWMAACDNVASCAGYTFQGEDFDYGDYVVIRRKAGPDEAATIAFVVAASDNETPAGEARFRVVLDGEPLAAVQELVAKPDETSGGWRAELRGDRALAFIDAVRNGDDIVLLRGDDQAARFSLAGLSATLLWFDETQGRLGAASALLRRGSKASPPAPPAPVVTRGPVVSQDGLPRAVSPAMAATADLQACDVDYAADDELSVWRLSPGTLLWAAPCSRGAYNTIFAMLLTDEAGGNVRHAVFPGTPGADKEQSGELMNVRYDPATRVLSNFDKARGLGDCGAQSDWVWTGSGFKLTWQAIMPDCRGVGFEDWPTTWTAEVR